MIWLCNILRSSIRKVEWIFCDCMLTFWSVQLGPMEHLVFVQFWRSFVGIYSSKISRGYDAVLLDSRLTWSSLQLYGFMKCLIQGCWANPNNANPNNFLGKSLNLFFFLLFRIFSSLNRLSQVLTYRISVRVDEEAVIVLLKKK